VAASFYVGLFSVCRQLAAPYRSSNPTWTRRPRGKDRIAADRQSVLAAFTSSLESMADTLASCADEPNAERAAAEVQWIDSTSMRLAKASVDMVLTSPPYCTRIDYSAATRIELAVLHPLVKLTMEDLGRRMIGSTRVPDHDIAVADAWGETCRNFLAKLKAHPSKASKGYYYKTHLDYFEKMCRSLENLVCGLKPKGTAVLVIQDSYKDIHNDLPTMTVEMAQAAGLKLGRREDFHFKRSMAGINPHTRTYNRAIGAVESVLCFEKIAT
jgi:hypothetical protein